MRILAAAAAFCLTSLGWTAAPRAEDFTGFYAGVNAGYAFARDRDDRGAGTAPAPSTSPDTEKLPPSAASAARTMRAAKDGAVRDR